MHHSLSTGNLRVTWGISNPGSQLLEQVQAVRWRRALRQGPHSKLHTAAATFPPTACYLCPTLCKQPVSWFFIWSSLLPRRRTVFLSRGEDSRDQREQLRDCHRASGACCLSIWLSLLHSTAKLRRKHPLKDSFKMYLKKLHRITEAEKSVFRFTFCLSAHPQKWHQPSLETEIITLFFKADVLTT